MTDQMMAVLLVWVVVLIGFLNFVRGSAVKHNMKGTDMDIVEEAKDLLTHKDELVCPQEYQRIVKGLVNEVDNAFRTTHLLNKDDRLLIDRWLILLETGDPGLMALEDRKVFLKRLKLEAMIQEKEQ